MGRIGIDLTFKTPIEPDMSRHMYVCGETGIGKTTLLHNLMVEDIRAGRGFAFFDPHGDEAENLLNFIPKHRVEDVIYFAPQDRERPVTFNPLGIGIGYADPDRIVQAIANAFKAIWPDTEGEGVKPGFCMALPIDTAITLISYRLGYSYNGSPLALYRNCTGVLMLDLGYLVYFIILEARYDV